jgi:hypothetical protein
MEEILKKNNESIIPERKKQLAIIALEIMFKKDLLQSLWRTKKFGPIAS